MEKTMNDLFILSLTNTDKKVIIDYEDFSRIQKQTWHLMGNIVDGFCVYTTKGTHNNRYGISLAKFILNYTGDLQIDHKNRLWFDNRKNNLRIATTEQNSFNKDKYKNGLTSKYKGVDFLLSRKKWRARIQKRRNQIHLGLFSSEQEAALAYNNAVPIYHGEFGVLNTLD